MVVGMEKEKKPIPETHSLGFAIGALLIIFSVVTFFMGGREGSLFILVLGAVVLLGNHFIKYGNTR
jgi:hypothetical protein